MLLRKTIFLAVAVLSWASTGFSQVSATDSAAAVRPSPFTRYSTALPLHKLSVGVVAGTQFTATSGYGSGLSTYVSPTLTYPVSKRFLLRGGIGIVNTSLYGVKPFYSTAEQGSYTGNFTQAMIWVSGQYQLNDHLTLTGTAYKSFDVMNDHPSNSSFYRNNPQGALLNVGYKVNDVFQINVEVGYSKGYNPYNSYGIYSPYSPFDPSPVGFGYHGR
jgi:hypothetical protein